MTGITCNTKGVWSIDDTYKKVLSDYLRYNNTGDPGTLWAWGQNQIGQFGLNSVTPFPGAVTSPTQVPGVNWCTASIKSDNTLWTWGFNSCGSLGTDETIHRSSPVQIPGNWCTGGAGSGIKTDGTLWSWGYNIRGQVGDGTSIPRSSPVQVPGIQWVEVTGARQSTFARKSDGTLWSWGYGYNGNLGTNSGSAPLPRSSPVQIPGNSWVQVSGLSARKTDGTLWSWGCNGFGEVGDGTTIIRSSPVQIPGNQWCSVSWAGKYTWAFKTDGTMWAMGCNSGGTLGDNSIIWRSSPVQIPGTQWTGCLLNSGLVFHALKTDGTLWNWGTNSYMLGPTFPVPPGQSWRSSPVQVPGTCWFRLGAGSQTVFALKRQ